LNGNSLQSLVTSCKAHEPENLTVGGGEQCRRAKVRAANAQAGDDEKQG